MMHRIGVPYERKALYVLITVPMVVMYVAIAIHLWTVREVFAVIYCAFFVFVMIFQSYNCIYWRCPHVGTLCPGAGGFCIPSSYIAKLFRHAKRSKALYNLFCTLAYLNFFGIIFFPMYFIYRLSVVYLLAYLSIVVAYALGMLVLICPVCGARDACPGGQTAVQLRGLISK